MDFKLSLDGANEEDILFSIEGIPFIIDKHSNVFIFKNLHISYDRENGFVIEDL